MADVFISYCHKERPRVLPLAERLRDLGLDVWFDVDLQAGADYNRRIIDELKAAKAIIVCWSEASTNSDYVRCEAQIGVDRKTLVPCRIESCTLWPPYNLIQTEDLTGWLGEWTHEGFQRFVGGLAATLKRPALAGLSAACADPSGAKLALWVSAFAHDPAAADAGALWERAQREQFKIEIAHVRQTLAKRFKQRQKKIETRLTAIEADFASWIARTDRTPDRLRPDPKILLGAESAADATPDLVSRAAPSIGDTAAAKPVGLLSPPMSPDADPSPRRAVSLPLAASLAVGLLVGAGAAALLFKPSATAHAGPTETAASQGQPLGAPLGSGRSVAIEPKNEKDRELEQARKEVQNLTSKLKDMLQAKAHDAVMTYYKLHENNDATSVDTRIGRLKDFYAERFDHNGFPVDRDTQLKDLRNQVFAVFDKLAFQLLDKSFDYKGCVDQHACLVKGVGRSTWVKHSTNDEGATEFQFALLFDLGDPIQVRSECANAPACR